MLGFNLYLEYSENIYGNFAKAFLKRSFFASSPYITTVIIIHIYNKSTIGGATTTQVMMTLLGLA